MNHLLKKSFANRGLDKAVKELLAMVGYDWLWNIFCLQTQSDVSLNTMGDKGNKMDT